ncbi:hypothetical protein C1646_711511 [Rhizophagus diaphanus]|nr:hypothetical protein C1646_711511 [Rhizophagus diaphanus] [Rhizophagus sp. MUCL 43196]
MDKQVFLYFFCSLGLDFIILLFLLTNLDSSPISYISKTLFLNLNNFPYNIFWTCIIFIILIILITEIINY